ncbi:MAG: VOC family protein [Pseudomonadales bacterium]
MKYLHTMVRVSDLNASIRFYCEGLGMQLLSQQDYLAERFTLVFLAAPGNLDAQIELTYNWDQKALSGGRNFGHLAYQVENIYTICQHLKAMGVVINRPPHDGLMAFVRSPDDISIELLQIGQPLPPRDPWKFMPNKGAW